MSRTPERPSEDTPEDPATDGPQPPTDDGEAPDPADPGAADPGEPGTALPGTVLRGLDDLPENTLGGRGTSPAPASPDGAPAGPSVGHEESRQYGYGRGPSDPPSADQEDQDPAPTPPPTAPRAVLRPVPEGFGPPPAAPERPNRAPALPEAQDSPPRSRKRLAILLVALIAAIVLVLGVGGTLLALRALTEGDEQQAAPAASSEPTSDGPGELQLGQVHVSEVSTEPGVTVLGDGAQTRPEGEFVIVTLEVTNDSDLALILSDAMSLETDDGVLRGADAEATRAHQGDSSPYGVVDAGESTRVHAVFDVPVGTSPVSLHLDLLSNPDAGAGVLTLR